MRLLGIPGLPVDTGDDMAAPVADPIEALHGQIREALTELRGARASFEHCCSTENQQLVEYAEWRLGRLLDRLPRQQEASC